MSNLYQRMTETLAIGMGDTLTVNQQFQEAVTYMDELEQELDQCLTVHAKLNDENERLREQAACPYAHNEMISLCTKCGWQYQVRTEIKADSTR